MILVSLLEVRNLKNIIKLKITITEKIMLVIAMKKITTIKAARIIKLIALRCHQPQKKLFSYLEGDSMVKTLNGLY